MVFMGNEELGSIVKKELGKQLPHLRKAVSTQITQS